MGLTLSMGKVATTWLDCVEQTDSDKIARWMGETKTCVSLKISLMLWWFLKINDNFTYLWFQNEQNLNIDL